MLALVTGASSGIGRQFAVELALMGADVLLVSNQEKELAETASMLASMCGDDERQFKTLCIDLTRDDAASEVFGFCQGNGLNVDILINNAGIFSFREITDTTSERIGMFVDLHVRAVSNLCRMFAIDMKSRDCHGYILNMSSMACWMPMPGIAMYSATKAYIRVFSRSLNVELADSGITVMAACPGGIATDLFGLPSNLQRLGVALGVLCTPERFVHMALKRLLKRRHQYVNGLVNRLAILFISILPDRVRLIVKHKLLDKNVKR